jgi:streptomycin 6-kinase
MNARERLAERARAWNVDVGRILDSPTSLLAFGTRDGEPVVLKIVRHAAGDEWHAGSVAARFDGRGMVRVHEHVPGASLMDAVLPGTPLTDVVRAGSDDIATDVLCDVVEGMLDAEPAVAGIATAEAWGAGFERYLDSGAAQVPLHTVERAYACYRSLCASQTRVRLLHGDLQHTNVLSAGDERWLAIDPKGVVAELAFELGPIFRNPPGMPEQYTAASIERRARRLAQRLELDVDRILAWAFCLAVLSAVWTVEDEAVLSAEDPAVQVFSALDGIA